MNVPDVQNSLSKCYEYLGETRSNAPLSVRCPRQHRCSRGVGNGLELVVDLQGVRHAWCNDNLDSSELLVLGGTMPNSVGYPLRAQTSGSHVRACVDQFLP